MRGSMESSDSRTQSSSSRLTIYWRLSSNLRRRRSRARSQRRLRRSMRRSPYARRYSIATPLGPRPSAPDQSVYGSLYPSAIPDRTREAQACRAAQRHQGPGSLSYQLLAAESRTRSPARRDREQRSRKAQSMALRRPTRPGRPRLRPQTRPRHPSRSEQLDPRRSTRRAGRSQRRRELQDRLHDRPLLTRPRPCDLRRVQRQSCARRCPASRP